MENKNLCLFTKHKFSNRIIFTLLEKENKNKIEEKDLEDLLFIKNRMDKIFQFNLFASSSIYILIKLFLLKKLNKRPFINNILDLIIIGGVSFSGGYYLQKYNYNHNKKKVEYLKNKYSILIKNSLINSDSININNNNKQKRDTFDINDIHNKYNYYEINFTFLVLLRLLL